MVKLATVDAAVQQREQSWLDCIFSAMLSCCCSAPVTSLSGRTAHRIVALMEITLQGRGPGPQTMSARQSLCCAVVSPAAASACSKSGHTCITKAHKGDIICHPGRRQAHEVTLCDGNRKERCPGAECGQGAGHKVSACGMVSKSLMSESSTKQQLLQPLHVVDKQLQHVV